MPRGRRRSQPVRTAPADVHGERVAQERAQQAVPLPATAAVSPADLSPLDAPSGRPDEPITAGLNIGPGAGREALAFDPTEGDDVVGLLAALYERHPNDDLRQLLDFVVGSGA